MLRRLGHTNAQYCKFIDLLRAARRSRGVSMQHHGHLINDTSSWSKVNSSFTKKGRLMDS